MSRGRRNATPRTAGRSAVWSGVRQHVPTSSADRRSIESPSRSATRRTSLLAELGGPHPGERKIHSGHLATTICTLTSSTALLNRYSLDYARPLTRYNNPATSPRDQADAVRATSTAYVTDSCEAVGAGGSAYSRGFQSWTIAT